MDLKANQKKVTTKRKIFILILFANLLLLTPLLNIAANPVESNQSNPKILQMKISGTIDESTVMDVREAINVASEVNAKLIVVELSTPGGTVRATQTIMEEFVKSSIPIMSWVSNGASALSGGTYLLQGSHIAAMGDASQIGSCQPVDELGNPITDTKYVNALIELIGNKAEFFGRNRTQAERFVTDNLNLGENKALATNAINLKGSSLFNLLGQLESLKLIKYQDNQDVKWDLVDITTNTSSYDLSEEITFEGLSESEIVNYTSSAGSIFLDFLSNPIVLSLLFTIGMYALIFGLLTPGTGAELFGAICIILFLIGSTAIDVNLIVFLLIGVSVILFILETQPGSGHGILATGGTILMIVAVLFLLPSSSWLATPSTLLLSRILLSIGALTLGGFFFLVGVYARKTKSLEGFTGKESYIGQEVVVTSRVEPNSEKPGKVLFQGSYWKAKSKDEVLKKDDIGIIEKVEGLTLWIKRKDTNYK